MQLGRKLILFDSASEITLTDQLTTPAAGATFNHESDFWLHLQNVTTPGAANSILKIFLRYEDDSNHLRCNIFGNGRVYIFEIVEGSSVGTVLVNVGDYLTDGQDLYLRVEGGSVRVWQDDTEKDSASGLDTYVGRTTGEVEQLASGPPDGSVGVLTTWPLAANLK